MKNGWGKAVLATVGMCASGTAGLCISAAAMAQDGGPAAGAVPDRGQIEQNIPEKDLPRPSTAQVDASHAIAPAPCALQDSDIQVNLTTLSLEKPDGSPLAPELQELLAGSDAGMQGQQSVAVVCRVRDRINDRLSEAGYVALAQIPAQRIADGVLHIQIVTAHIIEIRIVGDPGPFRAQLEERIERIRALDPLNRREAERILLLTGDIPGVDVKLSLSSANGAPGDVIGTLGVETQRFALMANVQNYGSKQLGRWIGSIRGEAYGLTGLADRTWLAYSNALDWKEVRVLQAGHDFALNDAGLRLGLRGSLALSRPDIEGIDLRSRSVIAGLDLSMPLKRTVKETIAAAAGFELLEQKAQFYTSGNKLPFTLDKLRVIYARLDGDFHFRSRDHEYLRAQGSLEVRKGLDVFDATKRGVVDPAGAPSRLFGNPQATVIRGSIEFDIKPKGPFQLDLSGFGQWTDDPLLNLEEFSVGNFTRGRGYDPGSNGGDRAYGFSLQPRVKLPVPSFDVEANAFYDWVHIENLDPGSSEPKRTLRSVGGGLRFILPQRLILDLTYAHPLDRVLSTDLKKPTDRFLISLTAKLF